MAPNVSRRKRPGAASHPKPDTEAKKFEIVAHAEKIIADIKKRTKFVGDDFSVEARKSHLLDKNVLYGKCNRFINAVCLIRWNETSRDNPVESTL